MIKKTIVASALTLLLGVSVSFAQQAGDKPNAGGGEHQTMFQTLDTDGDGKLSKAEADKSEKGRLKENFVKIDTNNDGFITRDEMRVFRQNNPKPEGKKQ